MEPEDFLAWLESEYKGTKEDFPTIPDYETSSSVLYYLIERFREDYAIKDEIRKILEAD